MDPLPPRKDSADDTAETQLTPAGATQGPVTPSTGGVAVGESIGPYHLIRALGEGGMGVVYLAEQTEPIRRTVAVKVIRLGMNSRDIVARFESERQALALMDHSNIARVLDAGATPDGRPFFVMEHVDGLPLTEYCDRQRLSTRERLGLLTAVCAGVQHAHQKGIIHRDLKPSNVLVTEQDGVATPKIIDFGIAKATAQSLTERTMLTELGQFIGTPDYMSPEQMAGAPDIDATTDIYALGVILYELLTGALPFDSAALRRAGFAEMQRIVREDEPPRPSTKLASLGATSLDVAARRRTDAASLQRQLRGDLDWIALKATEKDRRRRYASASELAADIDRYLNDEPVLATPPSLGYRAQKFVRRHRMAVTAAALILLAIVAGLATTLLMYRRAELARAEAERHACAANVLAADMSLRAGNTDESRRRLDACPPDLRRWEWHYLDRAIDASARTVYATGDVQQLTVSADGRDVRGLALTGNGFGSLIRLVTTRLDAGDYRMTRAQTGSQIALSRDGRLALVSEWTATDVSRASDLPGTPFVATRGTAPAALAPSTLLRLVDLSTGTERFTLDLPGPGRSFDRVAVMFRGTKGSDFTMPSLPPDRAHPAGSASMADAFQAIGEGRGTVATLSGMFPYVVDGAFSADGRRVAAWSWSNDIRVWDTSSGRLVATLAGHTDGVMSVAFSRDTTRLVSASYDQTAVVWDLERQQRVATFRYAVDRVLAAEISSDGRRVVTASAKGVRLWVVGRTDPLWTREDIGYSRCVTFSPDGQVLAACAGKSLFVLDASTGVGLVQLRGHTQNLSSVAFSSDGTRLVSGAVDATMRVWDLADASRSVVTRHDDDVGADAVAWTAGGRLIASTTPHDVRLASTSPGAPVSILTTDATRSQLLEIGGSDVRSYSQSIVAASGDGTTIAASADATIRVWKSPGGEPLAEFKGQTSTVSGLALSRDGSRLYSSSQDRTIRSWDTHAGRLIASGTSAAEAYPLLLTPDERWLVTGAQSTAISIWDARTLTLARSISNHGESINAVAVRSDAVEAVTISDEQTVRVVSLATGRLLRTAKSPGTAQAAVYSPDGTRIAAALANGSIVLWDAATLELVLTLPDDGMVHGQNGTHLLTAGMGRNEVFEGALSRTGYSLGRPQPIALAFSPDGMRLATGWTLDGTVRVFNGSPRNERQRALDLVDRRFVELIAMTDVIENITTDRSESADLRKAAVALARDRGDDPIALNSAAWRVVKQGGASEDEYQQALHFAEIATTLTPDHPGRLNTLALAQYRTNRAQDALDTIARVLKLRKDNPSDSVAGVLARLRLGRIDAVRSDLATLEGLKNPSADLSHLIAEAREIANAGQRR